MQRLACDGPVGVSRSQQSARFTSSAAYLSTAVNGAFSGTFILQAGAWSRPRYEHQYHGIQQSSG